MTTLPMDLITDILLRLPAKFVVRFKSVCKLWYDLISGPDFMKLHLERSLATNSNLHFVIRTPVLHLADFDTFENPLELDYPFKRSDHGGAQVVGSCVGLLCLWNYDFDLTLFLYNPTTQTHRVLPFLPMFLPFSYTKASFNFGFGYDSFSKDYKCVRILQRFYNETGSFDCEVMVYSFKSNSWHKAQDVPYYFYVHRGESALLNETIHWIGHEGGNDDGRLFCPILCFNLKDETFSSLGLPNSYIDPDVPIYNMVVGVLDGCLCLTVNYIYYSEIWVMIEYGVTNSWVKLFSIGRRVSYEYLEGLVSYSLSRKELFLNYCLSHIASLNLDTMEVIDVKVSDFRRTGYAVVCVENLLMLNDAGETLMVEQEQGKKKSIWKRRRKRKKKNTRMAEAN